MGYGKTVSSPFNPKGRMENTPIRAPEATVQREVTLVPTGPEQ